VRQSQNTTWRFSTNITPYIYRYVLINDGPGRT
jgi:hypothetical protein